MKTHVSKTLITLNKLVKYFFYPLHMINTRKEVT